MSDKKFTIDDLFSDKGDFDEDAVVKTLHPLLIIQRNTNSISFKGTTLSADQKILAYALAKKLLKAKGLIDSDMVTAQEIHQKTRIKKGTIDPNFKMLRENGLLVGKREYEIPAYKVQQVLEKLGKK